jgi:transposase
MRRSHRNTRHCPRQQPGQKPRGCFQERVKQVGPEHFAIVPVDCGKPEARARVADFYGNVLVEPFTFDISQAGLQSATLRIADTFKQHDIRDCVCAIETTGRYHRPVERVFQERQWDTRYVHPFTSALIRRSADLGNKTDDIDLAAIHRAAVNGLAMQPEILDQSSQHWRLLTRHRRDLVEKAATLKVQLKESIDAYLPGYTRLWKRDSFWDSPNPLTIAITFPSAQAMRDASDEQFRQAVHDAGNVIQQTTIDRMRGWTHQAARPDDGSEIYFRRAVSLARDLKTKSQEISVFELDLAAFLCRSSSVLLLGFPGIHVISASDYGAELGPIINYANSKSIAGRAGLYPARWQSSQTDHPDGPLVARRNRQLRAAIMRLARNLDRSNDYFMNMADAYAKRHDDHDPKVVIARAFSRLSYYILAGERLFLHKAISNSEQILEKVLDFYLARHAKADVVTQGLNNAVARLSGPSLRVEQESLTARHRDSDQKKRRTTGLCSLGEILPQVLLRIQQRLQEESTQEQSEPCNESIHEKMTHGS